MAKKTKRKPVFEHVGSLITYKDGDGDTCLGYLFLHEGKAYEPSFGLVDVSPADAETHNRLLSEALVKGLDDRCEIGMCGSFYVSSDRKHVKTWTGEAVADLRDLRDGRYEFVRNGMTFVGRIKDEVIDFTRTA